MAARLGRYFWKLFLANAVVMAFVVTGCVVIIAWQLSLFRQEELSNHLQAQAAALEVLVRDRFDSAHSVELDKVAHEVGSAERGNLRVTFILADGTVLADSQARAAEMENHADRPEIREAMADGTGESVRWSHTVARNLKYVAVRVGPTGIPRGVVRVSMAVQSIAAQAEPLRRLVVMIALVSVLAAILLALALALLWSRRIQRVTEAARSISDGDLSARVGVVGHDEVAELGRTLNDMRQRLSIHLDTIDRQRRTLDSLVGQLREGVIVADALGKIILLNPEAAELLQLPLGRVPRSPVGQPVEEYVPQRKLQDMLHRPDGGVLPNDPEKHDPDTEGAHQARSTETQEIELRIDTGNQTRYVLARAFDIRLPVSTGAFRSPTAGAAAGRALVLTDVTELTRVMQVKADLAANASHELRTPLSAIRAAVDTLRSLDSRDSDADLSKFVDVIDRHSARMEAMIGDLLDLSRLESGTRRFEATSVSARAILEELRTTFADPMAAKSLAWKAAIPGGDVVVKVSPELLRMILRNLIDNAIRFTDRGEIEISVRRDDQSVIFEVRDTGCGIPPKDQPRVFERFYQAERARSGTNRGTGLGLSIVRHAASAMRAEVRLQSELGKGTRVSLRVPV